MYQWWEAGAWSEMYFRVGSGWRSMGMSGDSGRKNQRLGSGWVERLGIGTLEEIFTCDKFYGVAMTQAQCRKQHDIIAKI